MRKRFLPQLRRPVPARDGRGPARGVTGPMLFLFALGVLAGAVVGTVSPSAARSAAGAGDYLSAAALPATLPLALWNAARFFLLLLLAATSWLGVLFAPAAALLRGYLLSCSVSALYAAWSWRGLLCAFLVSGVPALALAPCFILAACDAYEASRWLLEHRFALAYGAPRRRGWRRAALTALLVALEALYSFYLLPVLLSNL